MKESLHHEGCHRLLLCQRGPLPTHGASPLGPGASKKKRPSDRSSLSEPKPPKETGPTLNKPRVRARLGAEVARLRSEVWNLPLRQRLCESRCAYWTSTRGWSSQRSLLPGVGARAETRVQSHGDGVCSTRVERLGSASVERRCQGGRLRRARPSGEMSGRGVCAGGRNGGNRSPRPPEEECFQMSTLQR